MKRDTQIFTSEFHELVGAFDQLNDCILLIDPETEKIVNINRSAEKLYGYSKEEFTSLTISDICVEPLKFRQFIYTVIAEGISLKFETKQIGKDRKVHFLEINPSMVTYNNSTAILCAGRDIGERIAVENRLRKSEQQLQEVFDNAPIGKTLTSLNGRLLRVNKAFCNLLGYTREELLSGDFQKVTHKDDLKRNLDALEKAKSENSDNVIIEKRYVKKDGSVVFARTHVSIVKDLSGRPDKYIAQVIDITRQKQDEERLRATEMRLSALLNNLSDIVFYESDSNGVFMSDNVQDLLGYSSADFAANRNLFENLMHQEDRAEINKQVRSWQVEDNPGILKFEFRVKKNDGTYIWIEDHMFGIKSDIRSYWSGYMIDVTDRKSAEKQLAEIQNRLATVLNKLPNVIFYETEAGRTFVSENVYDILGYTAKQIEKSQKLFGKRIHPEDLEHIISGVKLMALLKEKKYVKDQFRFRKANGEYIWLEDHMYEASRNGKPYVVGFMMDITERKKTEQRLEETQTRLAAVLNNLPNVVFYENAFGKQFISQNIFEMLGYPVEDFYADGGLFDSLIHPEEIENVIAHTNDWYRGGAEGVYKETFRIKRKDGIYIWLEDHMFKTQKVDGENYYSGVMIDISERKKIEYRIEESLREKEILIKEIHHRVKNNLQVVSSLLKLQSTYLKDKDALDMLLDSQNRVQSMALVHQRLYQSKDLSSISLNEYIHQLLRHVINSVASGGAKVKLKTKIEDIKVGVDTAIPCGLIINELVTNSIKHAFTLHSDCVISLTLKETAKGSYELVVSDNGKGFPAELDFRNTASLGLQLVNTLVSQLEGEIELIRNGGTAFRITFSNIG